MLHFKLNYQKSIIQTILHLANNNFLNKTDFSIKRFAWTKIVENLCEMETLVYVDMTKLNLDGFLEKYPSSKPIFVVRWIARYIFRLNRHEFKEDEFNMYLVSQKNSKVNKCGPKMSIWILIVMGVFFIAPICFTITGIVLYCRDNWNDLKYLALFHSLLYLFFNLALYLFVCIIIQVKIYTFNYALYKLIEHANKKLQPTHGTEMDVVTAEDTNSIKDPFSSKALQTVNNA